MALKVQLNFHQKVLGVKCCWSLIPVTSGGNMKDIFILIRNLKEVISSSKDTNSNSNAETDFSKPIFVTRQHWKRKKYVQRESCTNQPEREGKSSGERKYSFRKEAKKKDNRANQKGKFEKSKSHLQKLLLLPQMI